MLPAPRRIAVAVAGRPRDGVRGEHRGDVGVDRRVADPHPPGAPGDLDARLPQLVHDGEDGTMRALRGAR